MKLEQVNIVEKEQKWNMYGHVIGNDYHFHGKRDTVVIPKEEQSNNSKQVIDFILKSVPDHKTAVRILTTGYCLYDSNDEVLHSANGTPHRVARCSIMYLLKRDFGIKNDKDVNTFVLNKQLSVSNFHEVCPLSTVSNLNLE